jgi:osmotically-inducible protein OsmY
LTRVLCIAVVTGSIVLCPRINTNQKRQPMKNLRTISFIVFVLLAVGCTNYRGERRTGYNRDASSGYSYQPEPRFRSESWTRSQGEPRARMSTGYLVSQNVRSRIASATGLSGPYRVEASVRNERVTLSGTVNSPGDIDRIGMIALNTPGVRSVDNQLRARRSYSDDTIRDRAWSALRSQPGIDTRYLDVRVDSGVATLTGSLPNSCLIDQALTAVGMADGVRDVRSELTMNGRPYRSTARCPSDESTIQYRDWGRRE